MKKYLISDKGRFYKANLIYFRITVTDKCGLHANINAYFTDELL